MNSWDKLSLESYKEKCEKLEKENEKYIITFSSLYDNDRQYTKKIKEQEDLIDTLSDQLAEEKHFVKIKQTEISELEECLRNKDFENEHLKSKVVDCTMCQNLQEQVEELKSVIESFNLSIEEFDSIKQKNAASQVFTKSIPKVNVSDKIYTGESSKPISKKVSQFTTYSLQKDKKYLKKQHSSETFVFQNHMKNESSKQIWKSKENISKRFKYSRDEMFSMRKRDDSILKKVKDLRFPFISKRNFPNETPSFNNKWKSSSSSRINTSNETSGFKTMLTPLKSVKTPNETSRFYKSKWTNEKSFKSPLIPRMLFQNETQGFNSPWNSTSVHQIDATYIWFSKYGKPVSNILKWVPKVVV
nr:hypothetical protein [Tanacetum cinerariifolium]